MILRRQSTGEVVTLASNSVGRGGEARIYPVATDPQLVAKVYHNPTVAHAQKLALMLARPWPACTAPQRHHPIAWPLDLLIRDDKGHTVAGFLMWRATGMFPIYKFYTPQTRRVVCPMFDYRYLHRVARNIAAVVNAAHQHGFVIGDINESSALAGNTALVTWVDTDSFQIRDPSTGWVYRCEVGKPDFTPPELQGKHLGNVDRSPEQDRFGLAVIIFRLLMEGTHPFGGKFEGYGDPPPLGSRISSGHFPHGKKRVPWSPKPVAPPFGILHPTLRQLAIRCFEDGHHDPSVRPDAQTLMKGVGEAETALTVCKKNSQHLFGNHLQACPWCQRKALFAGLDPFPPAGISQPRPWRRRTQKLPARPPTFPAAYGLRQPRQMQRVSAGVPSFASTIPSLGGSSRPPVVLIIVLVIVGIILMLPKT
jgi:DNA-binding helix-hairpin-helix protein with protein kinase domain